MGFIQHWPNIKVNLWLTRLLKVIFCWFLSWQEKFRCSTKGAEWHNLLFSIPAGVSDRITNGSMDGTKFVDKMYQRIFISKSIREVSKDSICINIQVRGQGMDWKFTSSLTAKECDLALPDSLDTFASNIVLTNFNSKNKEASFMKHVRIWICLVLQIMGASKPIWTALRHQYLNLSVRASEWTRRHIKNIKKKPMPDASAGATGLLDHLAPDGGIRRWIQDGLDVNFSHFCST